MKSTTQCLALFALLFAPCFAAAAPIGEHVQNPRFDPGKPPVLEQAPPKIDEVAKRWEAALRKNEHCEPKGSWALKTNSQIEATVIKDKNIPVPGKFTRVLAQAKVSSGSLKGEGTLDMTSWDSGLPARDHRVMKYVFGVEEPSHALMDFNFKIHPWVPDQPHANPKLETEFKFRGKQLALSAPVEIKAQGRSLAVRTLKAPKLAFLQQAHLQPFLRLLELCNHQFLGTQAQVALELVFEPGCTKR